AAAVLIAGPVAFVGLIAPHLARSLVGPGHRALGPAAACVGAAMLVGADAGASAGAAAMPGVGRLPVGLVAALGGGPVFLVMLRRYLGRGGHEL
ncbi:MAG: iron chelate uptake ABC transporter family permease subunit, partial [Planctomycetota bacterium]